MGRKIIAFILLLLLTFESIGLTVVFHLCSSGHRAEINSVNGVSSEPNQESCCCSDRCHDSEIPVQDEIAFQPLPCCTNDATYIKLESDFYPPVSFNLLPLLPVQTIIYFTLPEPEALVSFVNLGQDNGDHWPPPKQNRFLISVHQLKIAGHCC